MAMCLILALARLLLNRLQEPVQLAGVVAEDLALDGRVDRAEVLGDPLLRVGPDAVGMGIVRAPHDVVLADERDHHGDRGLVLIGRIALPAPQLARLHREVELVVPVLVLLVHPVEDVRQPAHAGLAEHELETREAIESAREHDARRETRRRRSGTWSCAWRGSGGRTPASSHRRTARERDSRSCETRSTCDTPARRPTADPTPHARWETRQWTRRSRRP